MHNSTLFLRRAVVILALIGSMFTARAGLSHRYSFTGNVNDSVGAANGQALQLAPGGTPIGVPVTFDNNQANLDGTAGYIELPTGLFTNLTETTIEAWVTWNGQGNWVRIFDFGNSTSGKTGPDQAIGTGQNYMFLTPNGGGSLKARFAITDASNTAERPILNDTVNFPVGVETHVAVTYGQGFAKLFVGGRLAATGVLQVPLSSLQETNNWLGRSQWGDPLYGGSINEFRIHTNVLSGLAIAASALSSPDTLDCDPGTISAVSLTVDANMVAGGVLSPTVTATYSKVGEQLVTPPDVTITSSATNIVFVNPDGTLKGTGIGTATITAKSGAQQATATITVSPGAAPALKHRYSFNEPAGSTSVSDAVGGQDGTAFGGLSGTNAIGFGNGKATFPLAPTYQEGTYISLPPGIISSKTNITLETWMTSGGTANWQRLFDIGQSSKPEPHGTGTPQTGQNYMFFTTRPNAAGTRFAVRAPGAASEAPVINGGALSLNVEHHVVIVYAPDFGLAKVYVDGVPVGTAPTTMKLNQFTDQYVWLGASLWAGDSPFQGAINEFRIYEGALTDIDVAVHRSAGPDALPVEPGALQSVSIDTLPQFSQGQTATRAAIFRANFANVTNVDVTALGPTFVSSDTNIFTVNAAGVITVKTNVGTANIVGTYQQKNATGVVSVAAPIALRLNITNLLYSGQPVSSAALRADYPNNVLDQNVTGFTGATYSSSDTGVFTVAANGNVTPLTPGTATLKASYGGLTVTKAITVEIPPNWKRGTLVHRYSFDGPPDTTTVTDSIGGADGFLVGGGGTNFTGTGQVAFPGGANGLVPAAPYVDLPNGIISSNSAITLEGWATVRSTAANMRYFDFGMSSGAPDGQGGWGEDAVGTGADGQGGRSYMFLTPGTANPRFAIKQGILAETPSITSSLVVTQNVNQHFAVVYDPINGTARLYINGARAGLAAATLPLSVVDDRNNWLGRSQWPGDPLLNGVLDEFRIYNGPLMDSDIAASYAAGPDTVLTTYPSFARLRALANAGNLEIRWPSSQTGFTLQSSSTIGTGATWTTVGAAQTPDGSDIKVTVPIGSGSAFYRLIK